MPTVSVNKNQILQKLGKVYTDEEFFDLCFDFGIELDEITSERIMVEKEQGKNAAGDFSDEVIYKIDVPANRYDLLCIEGIATSLLVFLGKIQSPKYIPIENPNGRNHIFIKPSVKLVRPHIVGAILRNITFTKEIYDSFIDLQEKLHQNICRKRSLVSIGTHDLDSIQPPFFYDAHPPETIQFQALGQSSTLSAVQLFEVYRSHPQLKQYLPLIQGKSVYPVVKDSNHVILSLPPIINSEHSKITLSTRNVLIECASNDFTKANIVLNTMIAMFSQYCHVPYSYEPVDVVELDGTVFTCPDMKIRHESVDIKLINQRIGFDLSPERVSELLTKMSLSSALSKDSSRVRVAIPPTRSDVLHPCDIIEDVAIAFGYDNIPKTIPATNTIGNQFPLNKLTDLLRIEVAMSGFTECLTFSLCSTQEAYEFLLKKEPLDDFPHDFSLLKSSKGVTSWADSTRSLSPSRISNPPLQNSPLMAVQIANPKTLEFQVARISLLPGILKTIASNKKMPLPMKLFEISDIVFQTNLKDVGASNARNFAALYYSKTPGLEFIHGLLDRTMQVLSVKRVALHQNHGYFIAPSDDSTFFPGRCVDIFYNLQKIGVMGVLHPKVLSNFDLNFPCAAFEISIECFV